MTRRFIDVNGLIQLQGYDGANSVVWNSEALGICVHSPPTAWNYVIGSLGQKQTGGWEGGQPSAEYDSHGIPVEPQSL